MVHWLALKRLPFNFLDDEASQTFFKSLNPHFDYPKKDAMRRRVIEEYEHMKKNLKEVLSNVRSVSFTVDAWTSVATKSYYGMTVHFIDEDWVLQSLALDFVASHGNHSGEDIAKIFYKTLEIYNLKKKIQGITLDNAASNTTFILHLGDVLRGDDVEFHNENQHFRCFSHILNLGVQDILKLLSVDIRENNSSESESELSDDIVGTELSSIFKVRKLFKTFRTSEQLQTKLKNCCDTINIKYIKPQIDVRTRWNSTYDMIKSAIELKPALNILYQNVPKIHGYRIDENEWFLLEQVAAFLKHFKQISTLLCGESYPTLPIVILSFNMLLDKIDEHIINYQNKFEKTVTDSTLLKAFIACKEKLLKHYSKTNWIYCAVLILDPRHKYETFSLTTWGREMKEYAISVFEKIYKEKYFITLNESPASSSSGNDNDDIDFTSLFEKPLKEDRWKKEIIEYLQIKRASRETDVLEWWKTHENQFPSLAEMAKDFLCIQATSVASERLFSQAGLINTKLRNMLNETSNKCLLCINSWCKSSLKEKLLK